MTIIGRICRFLIVLSIWFSAGAALACGGFFAPAPMDQTMERIIFTVNGDATITAIMGIGYTGEASEFSWLLPVPSKPQVDVADVATIDTLESYTRRTFISPDHPCTGVIWSEFEGVGGSGAPRGVEEGSVGPYDYAVLDDSDGAVIVQWLVDNGYNVPDKAVPIINDYAAAGMQFLAMKLRATAQVGDIQPVKVTFSGDTPMIPIKLAQIASVDPLPVLVWIFGDVQYEPLNYAHPYMDYGAFTSSLNFGEPRQYDSPYTMYQRQLDSIQADYNGQAFVTEYAAPTQKLLDALTAQNYGNDELLALLKDYAYVTRLRAQLSPEQMNEDVMFAPYAELAEDSTAIDLGNYHDPIDYWGCSTPARLSSGGVSETLTATDIVDGTPLWIPSGWQQSQLLLNLTPVYIYSPETANADTLRAFFAGESTPPMLVMFRGITEGARADVTIPQLVGTYYTLTGTNIGQFITLYQPFQPLERGRQTHIAFLTTTEDYQVNQSEYDAMLEFIGSYPFYASPDLRHTLFLTGGSYGEDPDSIQVGFPAAWRAHSNNMDESVILPDYVSPDYDDLALQPVIYVRSLNAFYGVQHLARIAKAYGISEESLMELDEEACNIQIKAAEFSKDGRQGYITVYETTGHGYVIEASAPSDQFESYQAWLKAAAESAKMPFPSCG